MRLISALVMSLVTLSSCTLERGTRPTTESAVAPEDAARAVVDSLSDAMARLDIDAVLQWYNADPSFTYAFDGTVLRGRPAFNDYIRNTWSDVKAIENFERESSYAYPLGVDGAVVTGAFRATQVDTADKREEVRAVWTHVVRKTPIGWRIVHGHTSYQSIE